MDVGINFSFKETGLLVDSVYCLTLLYIFCDCSHQASINIASRVQYALLETPLNTVDKHTAKEVILRVFSLIFTLLSNVSIFVQIELFLIAIQMNPPKVSLKGYTVVNRELVTSVRMYLFLLHSNYFYLLT